MRIRFVGLIVPLLAWSALAPAQDRLEGMPGVSRFETMRGEIPGSVKPGTLSVTWRDGGKAFEYQRGARDVRHAQHAD